MHDLLTDTLPTEWEGRAIDPDFRPMVWLLIRTRRVKTNEDSARLIASAIPLFFVEPIPVAQYPEAFESLVRFCQGGGPEDEERTGTGSGDPQDEPCRRKRRWARSWRSGARTPPVWTGPTETTTRP